jgi:hypothetical protein
VRSINPETEGVHPLRLALTDDELGDIANGIARDENWMSLEEIEAVADLLYDHIVAAKQTVSGVTTLQ